MEKMELTSKAKRVRKSEVKRLSEGKEEKGRRVKKRQEKT